MNNDGRFFSDEELEARLARYIENGKKPGALRRAIANSVSDAWEHLGENDQDQICKEVNERVRIRRNRK